MRRLTFEELLGRDRAPVLMSKGSKMNSDLVKRALDVIESGDQNAALDLLKEWIGTAAAAAGVSSDTEVSAAGDPSPDGDEDGSEGDGAEGVAAPKKASVDASGLTPRQLVICREKGITPEDFLRVQGTFQQPLKAASIMDEPRAIPGVFGGASSGDGGETINERRRSGPR